MTLKTTLIAATALIAASAAAAPAARAGNVDFNLYVGVPHAVGIGIAPVGYRGDRDRHAQLLSAREVRRLLLRHGYRNVRDIDRRGPYYVARAARRDGSVYRVRIHAFTGRIVGQDLVWTPRGPRYGYGAGHNR